MYYYGTQLWTNLIGIVIGGIFCTLVIVPVVYPLKFVSLFEVSEVTYILLKDAISSSEGLPAPLLKPRA